MNGQRQPLSGYDYDVQVNEIRRLHSYIYDNPDLASTSLGREARARLSTLCPDFRPHGPNASLVESLDRLTR